MSEGELNARLGPGCVRLVKVGWARLVRLVRLVGLVKVGWLVGFNIAGSWAASLCRASSLVDGDGECDDDYEFCGGGDYHMTYSFGCFLQCSEYCLAVFLRHLEYPLSICGWVLCVSNFAAYPWCCVAKNGPLLTASCGLNFLIIDSLANVVFSVQTIQ